MVEQNAFAEECVRRRTRSPDAGVSTLTCVKSKKSPRHWRPINLKRKFWVRTLAVSHGSVGKRFPLYHLGCIHIEGFLLRVPKARLLAGLPSASSGSMHIQSLPKTCSVDSILWLFFGVASLCNISLKICDTSLSI